MGQRHQLFVIAKVAGRYRGLAAVHNQNLYGPAAVQRCLFAMKILRANPRLLRQDLEKAKAHFRDNAKVQERNERFDIFPHAATCLMIGASAPVDERDRTHNIHPMAADTRLDEIDNNDGITVFDVTDPEEPRYCFVLFGTDDLPDLENLEEWGVDDPEQLEAARRVAASGIPDVRTPLTATEYLKNYPYSPVYDASDVDALPLIDVEALRSAWPESTFYDREADESTTAGVEQIEEGAPKTLREKALAELLERAVDSDRSDLSWLPEAEMLPNFSQALLQKLRSGAAPTSNPSWFPLLKRAIRGSQSLDLSVFEGMIPAQLQETIAEAGQHCTVSLPSIPSLTSEDLNALLANGKILDLHFGDTERLSLDGVLRAIDGKGLRRVSHPDMYQHSLTSFNEVALDHKMPYQWFPCGEKSGFPVSQLLFLQTKSYGESPPRLSDGVGAAWSSDKPQKVQDLWDGYTSWRTFAPVPLTDMLLSPDAVLDRLPGIVAGLATAYHFSSFFLAWHVRGWAMSSALQSDFTVLPIAAEMYATYEFMSRSNIGCPPPARPLRPGEWTLCVFHEENKRPETFEHSKLEIRYAFATIENGQLRVLSAEAFAEKMNTSCPGGLLNTDAERFERDLRSRRIENRTMSREVESRSFDVLVASTEEVNEAVDLMAFYNEGLEKLKTDPMWIMHNEHMAAWMPS